MAVEIPTFQEFFEIGKAQALAKTARLTEQSFADGFMPNIFTGLAAAMADEAMNRTLQLNAETFIRGATGAALDKLAEDHFGLARQPGVGALGRVTFSRPNVIAGNVTLPVGTVVATVDGVRFVTLDDTFLTGTSLDQDVRAEVVGESGNVAPGTITQLLSASPDPTITVTNVERVAGGVLTETDAHFRVRIVGYLKTLRRGTIDALVEGALMVAGVDSASVDESSSPISIYIADVTGQSNTALREAVADELVAWRSAGVQVNVLGAVVVAQPIEMALTYKAGFDSTSARNAAIQAVVDVVNALSIGDRLYFSQLISAVQSISAIQSVAISVPAGDVQPAANELLRTTTNDVEAT